MKRGVYLAAALWFATIPLTGCSVFEDEDDDSTPVTDSSMYGGIPNNAIRAASGYDVVRYRATQPARVIIGNDSRRMVITETQVQAGDEIVVDAGEDSVAVNGRSVYSQNLEKNDQHSIFVVPTGAGG
jgi:hypothetical protein